jgi:hypothetical protein
MQDYKKYLDTCVYFIVYINIHRGTEVELAENDHFKLRAIVQIVASITTIYKRIQLKS